MNASVPYVLPEKHNKELQRLIKAIKRPNKYNLLFVEYNDQALRRHLIKYIGTLKFQSSVKLDLRPEKVPTAAIFEENLKHLSQDYSIIHVYNLESRTSEDDFRTFLQEINLHRERIARIAPVNIIFWVLEYQTKKVITDAPDFWAWNSAVLHFHSEKVSQELEPVSADHAIAELNVPETRHRIETLIDYLKPKQYDSLNDAEKGLVQELAGYRRQIAIFEKTYGYLDAQLHTMKENITSIFNKFVEYQKTPDIPSGEMNIKDEISFIADQLEVKSGENFLDKELWIQPAVSLLEKVTEENEEVGTLANNLSLRYQDLGDYHNALAFAKKALEIFERTLQPDHPSLAISYNNVSMIYQDMGDYKNALAFAKKALEIKERTLQPDHPSLASSYNNVSMIYRDMGDYKNALSFAIKALEISERTLQPDHPYIATSFNNISLIYKDMGDYKNALVYAKKALEIRERTLQPDHPYIASSYNNISLIYKDMGDLKNALAFAKKDLEISERTQQPDHPDLATSYHNIATIYQNMNDIQQALYYAEKALAIVEKKLPDNHPHVKYARDHVKNLQKVSGNKVGI